MSAEASDRPFTIDDLLRLRTIREVDLDSDGRQLVMSVESFEPKSSIKGAPGRGDVAIRRHLLLLDLETDGAVPRPLTLGERWDSAPVFSPDGRAIAFVRKPDNDDPDDRDRSRGDSNDPSSKSQVWIISLEGGEAYPVTELEHGAARPRWSPDGRALLVESRIPVATIVASDGPPDWPSTRPGFVDSPPAADASPAGDLDSVRAWLRRNEVAREPRLIDRTRFLGERKVDEVLSLPQVFFVPLPAAGGRPMEPMRLGRGVVERREAAFMPDGDRVVMVTKEGNTHPDDTWDARLDVIDLDTPADARVLWSEAGYAPSSPQPGPDGSLVAFLAARTDAPNYRGRSLGLIPISGGEPIWATRGAWRDVDEFRWSRGGGRLLFTAESDGGRPFFTASPGMLEPIESHRLREGLPAQVHAFDTGGGRVAWVESTAGHPGLLRIADVTLDRNERVVFDPNPWIVDRRIVRPTESTVTREDGTEVRYWVLPPLSPEAEGGNPLLLAIHGGPMAMWGPAEPTMWLEWQLAATWGFGVVYANPRGSGGSGEAFQRANHRDWGPGPGGDCLAALDAACELPWVDRDRLVVTGGSYGGYLTTWLIANDDRFKAAVAQRGVYDLATFFGEGNAHRLVEWAFGDRPVDSEGRARLDEASPFRVADRISTPLLIMHGDRDLRTGVSQSLMLYRALRSLGRPVEFALYPGADHDLSRTGDPVLRMDRLARILEFLSRHVRVAGPQAVEDGAWPVASGNPSGD